MLAELWNDVSKMKLVVAIVKKKHGQVISCLIDFPHYVYGVILNTPCRVSFVIRALDVLYVGSKGRHAIVTIASILNK